MPIENDPVVGPAMFIIVHKVRGNMQRHYSEEQLSKFLEKSNLHHWWIYVLTQPETQEGDEDGREKTG